MNEEYLDQVKDIVDDRRLLINAISQRASELAKGAKPLIRVMPNDDLSYLDIAMCEMAEGRIVIQTKESE